MGEDRNIAKKYDVFISYLRADDDIAKSIYHQLSAVGIRCFFDASLITSGDDFARVIAESIESSKLVLYLCSDKSTQSIWVINEIKFALAKGIKVLPVIIDNASLPDELKFSLANNINGLVYNSSNVEDDIAHIVSEVTELLVKKEAGYQPTSKSTFQSNESKNDVAIEEDKGNITHSPSEHQQSQDTTPSKLAKPKFDKASKMSANIWWVGVGYIFSASIFTIGMVFTNLEVDVRCILFIISFLIFCVTFYIYAPTALHWFFVYCATEKVGHSSPIYIYVDGRIVSIVNGEGVAKVTIFRKGRHLISIKSADSDLKAEKFEYDTNKESSGNTKYVTLKKHSDLKTEQKNTVISEITNYKCFIAGSTRLVNERNATRAVLSVLYNKWEKYKLVISSYTFEDFSNGYTVGGQQIQYNEFIQDIADCAIFIVENGVGDKTLEEYKLAIATFKSNLKRPKVYVYANDLNDEPTTQTFIEEVKCNRSYWREYQDINQLMLLIKEDIDAELFNIFVINNKHS